MLLFLLMKEFGFRRESYRAQSLNLIEIPCEEMGD